MQRLQSNRRSVADKGIELSTLSKVALHELADGLRSPEPEILDRCVEFVVADTVGNWHGRARAMICRRLKHCELSPAQRAQLLKRICARLSEGTFSEQFKDQLRLALHLDLEYTLRVARKCRESQKSYVRRYAEWALSPEHLRPTPTVHSGA
jgi:hypothetical protein